VSPSALTSNVSDRLRRSFWLLPALGCAAALVAALLLPRLDVAVDVHVPVLGLDDAGAVRTMLQTVATATLSVGGLTFSVTVVALQLASQQLNPRVLRSFQGDRLNQATLAAFLATFVYALTLTIQVSDTEEIPQISVALAVVAVLASLALFVAFIQNIVVSLQAPAVIGRILDEAVASMPRGHPAAIGRPPRDPVRARADVRAQMATSRATAIHGRRGGFVTALDGNGILRAASDADAVVVQRAKVGDYVLTGAMLAEVWTPEGGEAPSEAVREGFLIGDLRTPDQDLAFPIRQLADIALRALSPSLNDPTTAINAIDALAELLVRLADADPIDPLRTADGETVHFIALVRDVDELVALGFDQVLEAARDHPAVIARALARRSEVLHAQREVPAAERRS